MKNGWTTRSRARAGTALASRTCGLRVLAWLGLFALCACEPSSPTVSDSNTNWLTECSNDTQCLSGSTCICGVCTRACEASDTCNDVAPNAICDNTALGISRERCDARGDGTVNAICIVACASDLTCSDDTLTCASGLCVATSADLDAALQNDAARDATLMSDAALSDGNTSDGSSSDGGESDGNTSDAAIADNAVRQLVTGLNHTCALLGSGAIKCWGDNAFGQLGLGDTNNRGDEGNEMGTALPAIDLGSGVSVQSITAGTGHTCALFVDGAIKCWGDNAFGQLGLGDTNSRGDAGNEMGSALPFVPLNGAVAVQVSAGDRHTCARFDDGRVACWGNNLNGELGLDDATTRGDANNPLPPNLEYVNLGAGARARHVVAAAGYGCALLEGDTVKCWGRNLNGQLGQGDGDNRGDSSGEMAALAAIDLGDVSSGLLTVEARGAHVCALLGSGSVRCWGFGGVGQLGLGGTATIGDQANEMGVNLASARLGANATRLSSGATHACAVLDGNALKCWGQNNAGQLGLGDIANRADEATEIDAALPAVMLPTGAVTSVAAGGSHTCVVLDDTAIHCFGEGSSGQLGRESTARIGDEAGEQIIPGPPVAL